MAPPRSEAAVAPAPSDSALAARVEALVSEVERLRAAAVAPRAEPPRVARMTFGPVTVWEGGPSTDLVLDVFGGNRSRFLACYEEARKIEAEPRGSVTIEFALKGDGSVRGLGSTEGEKHGEAEWSLLRCVRSVVRTLVFPTTRAAGNIRLELRFKMSDPP